MLASFCALQLLASGCANPLSAVMSTADGGTHGWTPAHLGWLIALPVLAPFAIIKSAVSNPHASRNVPPNPKFERKPGAVVGGH
jgi:hypothetical protein